MAMDKRERRSLFGRMLKGFAVDAEPEEVAEAAKMMNEDAQESPFPPKQEEKAPGAPAPAPTPAAGGGSSDVMAMLQKILEVLAQLVAAEKAEAPAAPEPEDSLDALAAELEGGPVVPEAEGEDAEVVSVETLPKEDIPRNPIPGADSMAAYVRTMKPMIAQIKDQAERKKAVDALTRLVRGNQPAKQTGVIYGDFLKMKKALDDAIVTQAEADSAYGDTIKNKYHRSGQKVQ